MWKTIIDIKYKSFRFYISIDTSAGLGALITRCPNIGDFKGFVMLEIEVIILKIVMTQYFKKKNE